MDKPRVKFSWYGLHPNSLDSQEENLLVSLGEEAEVTHEVLGKFPRDFPALSALEDGELGVVVLQDTQNLIFKGYRYTPVNYDGAPERFDGKNLIILFADPLYRSGMIRQIRAWVIRALNPVSENGKVIGYRISEHEIAPNPWGRASSDKRKSSRQRPKGKGWQVQVATKRRILPAAEITELTQEQLAKEAALVNLLGAFNYEVCMNMPCEKLHQIYLGLCKRLALVAEAAKTGGGEQFFRLVAGLSKEELSDREKVMPYFEAVLLYGEQYSKLSLQEREVADQYQSSDEQSHFSRIMDVGDLREKTKHQVGVADAGNPFIVRTLMNTARYREDLGIIVYYPLAPEPIVEKANFRNPLSPFQVRANYPYIACVVSAGDEVLARDLIEIYRKLITQYPLEITFLLMEEWLTSMRIADPDVSFTAAQVFQKDSGEFEVELVNAGGGAAAIRGSRSELICFGAQEEGYGFEQPVVGKTDAQGSHYTRKLRVEPKDEIFVFPRTRELTPDIAIDKLNRAQEVVIAVNPKRHQRLTSFEWTPEYAKSQLTELVETIVQLSPERVEIQFGHVHGDREPGKDQIVGSLIAGAFVRQLMACGIANVATRPISDNYHVVDRLNFPAWIDSLRKHSGLEITEITFEDALISRHLGDELIALLHRTQQDNIVFKGGSYYFSPPESDMVVELYDGVRSPDVPGRMGCVPFQLGYELYRLNPDWINPAYRDYITTSFPDSLVAKWWQEDPEATFQELMLKHVYMLPCAERMALKAQVDDEIDRPYRLKCMAGETIFLEKLLEATNLDEVVLLHVLENFYDTQEQKSTTLWQTLGLPRVNQWRVSFNRSTGRLAVLDWNRSLEYSEVLRTQ